MHQRELIEHFVEYLRSTRDGSLSVVAYPDTTERVKRDIDALAEGSCAKLAIEHTSLDTMPDQRRDNAHFLEITDGLRDALCEVCNDIHISVLLPSYAVPPGVNHDRRKAMKSELRNWLVDNVPLLPHNHGWHDVPGLPFRVFISKMPSERTWVGIARFDVDDEARKLTGRAVALIRDKAGKLKQYADDGYTTVLLIENADIALMNPGIMCCTVHDALQSDRTIDIDEIWFADTSIPDAIEYYCFGNGREESTHCC
jgi:hypothetical protein